MAKSQVLCLFTLLKMICHSVLGTDISHFRKKNICGSVQSKRQNDGLLIRLQTNDAFIWRDLKISHLNAKPPIGRQIILRKDTMRFGHDLVVKEAQLDSKLYLLPSFRLY